MCYGVVQFIHTHGKCHLLVYSMRFGRWHMSNVRRNLGSRAPKRVQCICIFFSQLGRVSPARNRAQGYSVHGRARELSKPQATCARAERDAGLNGCCSQACGTNYMPYTIDLAAGHFGCDCAVLNRVTVTMPVAPKHAWSQSDTHVEIDVFIPSTSAAKPDVFGTSALVKVVAHPYFCLIDLAHDVDFHKGVAVLKSGVVHFSLPKVCGLNLTSLSFSLLGILVFVNLFSPQLIKFHLFAAVPYSNTLAVNLRWQVAGESKGMGFTRRRRGCGRHQAAAGQEHCRGAHCHGAAARGQTDPDQGAEEVRLAH